MERRQKTCIHTASALAITTTTNNDATAMAGFRATLKDVLIEGAGGVKHSIHLGGGGEASHGHGGADSFGIDGIWT